jgi:DNA-binding response OmpR family regulator
MKILVIEDEADMLETIVRALQQSDYVVESAGSYHEALEKTGIYDYDCIILDLGLPGGSGIDILRNLKKENKRAGVIIVSARNALDDKVAGLDLGADDYLPKPFHIAELRARVKSVIRRRRFAGTTRLICRNIEIDTDNRTVFVNSEELPINRKEFDILLYLVVNKDRLVNKTGLAEHVWGDYIDEANSFDFIYSQIKNLRKKLREVSAKVEIQAVYGIGYKLVET